MFLSKRTNATVFPDGCFTCNNFKEAKGKLNLPRSQKPFAVDCIKIQKIENPHSLFFNWNTWRLGQQIRYRLYNGSAPANFFKQDFYFLCAICSHYIWSLILINKIKWLLKNTTSVLFSLIRPPIFLVLLTETREYVLFRRTDSFMFYVNDLASISTEQNAQCWP